MLESRLKAVRWIVTGRVQGVSYRYFTQQAARQLQLTGWVTNLDDGSVEVRVAGEPVGRVDPSIVSRCGGRAGVESVAAPCI